MLLYKKLLLMTFGTTLVTDVESVYCVVRIDSLYKTDYVSFLKG